MKHDQAERAVIGAHFGDDDLDLEIIGFAVPPSYEIRARLRTQGFECREDWVAIVRIVRTPHASDLGTECNCALRDFRWL